MSTSSVSDPYAGMEHTDRIEAHFQACEKAGVQPVLCRTITDPKTGRLNPEPLPGTTGRKNPYGTVRRSKRPSYDRLAFRVPPNRLILDVDQKPGGTDGAETLARAETELGFLPETQRLTSRGPSQQSGRLMFSVPAGVSLGRAEQWLKATFGPGVDVLTTDHRFSMAVGDLNPNSAGTVVVCYGTDNRPTEMWHADRWPMLPDTWLAAITAYTTAEDKVLAERDGDALTLTEAQRMISHAVGRVTRYAADEDRDGAAYREDLLKAARTLGGFIGTELVPTEDDVRDMLHKAVWEVWGNDPTRDEDQLISDGLESGQGLLFVIDERSEFDDGWVDESPQEPPVSKPEHKPSKIVNGAEFIFDNADTPPAIWGRGDAILLAEGEALVICAPQGVGKTTLAQQVALGRCGLPDFAELLGLPIVPGAGRVLYLAMDRPRQAARSFARMVTEDDRAILADKLRVLQGPPLEDVADNPKHLLELCEQVGADTLIVDSIKDAAVGLNDDKVGAGYNRARQGVLAAGIEVIELHHPRKESNDVKRVTPTLDDLYGSTWIGSGAGSVIYLKGAAGDTEVRLIHLKQPMEPVGPLELRHLRETGRTVLSEGESAEAQGKQRPLEFAKLWVSGMLGDHSGGRSESTILDLAKDADDKRLSRRNVQAATTALVERGYVRIEEGGRGAKLRVLVKPYLGSAADDFADADLAD